MGELDSTTRQKGARPCMLLELLNSSHVYSATILRKIDVETGQVASHLFFSASMRLNLTMRSGVFYPDRLLELKMSQHLEL
jgi:hypothetical protein